MSDVLDEHEQGEKVRKWLQENGSSILLGLALGFGGIWGYGKFNDATANRQAEAGDQYRKLTEAVDKKDEAAIKALTASLRDKHQKSPYAVLSALDEAARLTEEGKLDDALKTLQWAKDKSSMAELNELVAIRLARLQLAVNKPDEALSTVKPITGKGFVALAAEIRGDALAAKKSFKEALTAYEESLTHLDTTSPRRSLVEMKRDDLSTTEGS